MNKQSNTISNCPPDIVIVLSRPGCLTEAGEWNLVHNRNIALARDFGLKVVLNIVARGDDNSVVPQHLRNASYPCCIFRHKTRFFGAYKASYNALSAAIQNRPKAVILSGVHPGTFTRLLRTRNISAVYDLHGAVFDEIDEYFPYNYCKNKFISAGWGLSCLNSRRSDAVLCVTPELAEWSKTYFPMSEKFVVPCATASSIDSWAQHESLRKHWRSRLSIPESAVVIVHSGGLGVWQGTKAYFRDLSSVLRKIDNSIFLCLTGQRGAAENELRKLPGDISSKCRIDNVPASDLMQALCAADVGLLLREKTITNKVAFPNKIDEYLGAGLSIVTTDGLPAAARLVRHGGLSGWIMDGMELNLPQDVTASATLPQRQSNWHKAQVARKELSYPNTLRPFVSWVHQQG